MKNKLFENLGGNTFKLSEEGSSEKSPISDITEAYKLLKIGKDRLNDAIEMLQDSGQNPGKLKALWRAADEAVKSLENGLKQTSIDKNSGQPGI